MTWMFKRVVMTEEPPIFTYHVDCKIRMNIQKLQNMNEYSEVSKYE